MANKINPSESAVFVEGVAYIPYRRTISGSMQYKVISADARQAESSYTLTEIVHRVLKDVTETTDAGVLQRKIHELKSLEDSGKHVQRAGFFWHGVQATTSFLGRFRFWSGHPFFYDRKQEMRHAEEIWVNKLLQGVREPNTPVPRTDTQMEKEHLPLGTPEQVTLLMEIVKERTPQLWRHLKNRKATTRERAVSLTSLASYHIWCDVSSGSKRICIQPVASEKNKDKLVVSKNGWLLWEDHKIFTCDSRHREHLKAFFEWSLVSRL